MYTNQLTKRLACNRNLLNSDHTHYHQYYLLLERKSIINRMEWKLNAESLQPGNCHLIAPVPSLNQISVSSKLERTPRSSLNPTSETKAPPFKAPTPPTKPAVPRILTWRQYWASDFNPPGSAPPSPQLSSLMGQITNWKPGSSLLAESDSTGKVETCYSPLVSTGMKRANPKGGTSWCQKIRRSKIRQGPGVLRAPSET